MSFRRRLVELAAPLVSERVTSRSVLVQPVGAIEQHGSHLPLETDLLVAATVSEVVVDKWGDELDLWLLPPLAYTKSSEHSWKPGTISVSTHTFLGLLDDLGRAVAKLPAQRLTFVNAHGGNTALLNVACRDLRLAHGLMTFLLNTNAPAEHSGQSSDPELGMGIHAGLDETSVMLHLRPDLVDLSKAERHIPEALASNRHVRFRGTASFGWTSEDFGATGVIGDPTEASARRGELLFGKTVNALGEALTEIAQFQFPKG